MPSSLLWAGNVHGVSVRETVAGSRASRCRRQVGRRMIAERNGFPVFALQFDASLIPALAKPVFVSA